MLLSTAKVEFVTWLCMNIFLTRALREQFFAMSIRKSV